MEVVNVMALFSARRIRSVCIVTAIVAAALVAPGAANAFVIEQCGGYGSEAGKPLGGKGASLQELAQKEVWTKEFNVSANDEACNGTFGTKAKPVVSYTSTGSGPGVQSWGVERVVGSPPLEFGPKNAYIGTDEPPSPSQITEIESHKGTGTGKVLTIPVLQAAVSIDVHLPTGCTSATSTAVPGRLVLNNQTFEQIFRHKITKWSEIKDDGDALKPAGCEGASEITRVVRKEGSGTTSIFKKYLNVIEPAAVDAGKTWKELAVGSNNILWPEEGVNLVFKAKGSGIASFVGETPGTIGYANVADARVNGGLVPPTGGNNKAKFWVELEHNGSRKPGEAGGTYFDPASNKDVAAKANSSCTSEKYTDGAGKEFPPESAEDSWSEVTTATTQTQYALCGFTYDLSLTHFKGYEGEAGTEATTEVEARTAFDYLEFVVDPSTAGGQKDIAVKHDYLGLPKSGIEAQDVQEIAELGANKIAF
jgi:ABC-type phosphate transport system substrate-binding protein